MAETLAAPCLCPWPEQDAAPRHREGCPSAPAAPLEKARTILHRVYLQLGSQAPAEYNEAVETLLAALDADPSRKCECGMPLTKGLCSGHCDNYE